MAKINVTPASREITEHFAAGEHARAFERMAIERHAPLFFIRMGGVPRYDESGAPLNPPAVKATAERKARLEARAIAAAERNAKAKAERIAAAERFAAEEYAKWLESLGPITESDVDSYLASVAEAHTAEELAEMRAELLADLDAIH